MQTWKALVSLGFVLLLIAGVILVATSTRLSDSDVRRGLAPLAAMPLEQRQCATSWNIRASGPNDNQWRRLVNVWQPKGILIVPVTADRPGDHTYRISDVGVSLDVGRNGQPASCSAEDHPPYGYSASSTGNGVRCDGRHGDAFTIVVQCDPSRPLPTGGLAVFAHWDKLQVVETNEALAIRSSAVSVVAALAGLGALAMGTGVWRRRLS